MFERALIAGMGAARFGIGASVWIAPRAAMRVLGFEPDNGQVLALARLGGTRDLALGAIAIATRADPTTATAVARVNASVDGFDALAFAIALVRREGIDRAAVMGASSASIAAAIGAWLGRHRSLI